MLELGLRSRALYPALAAELADATGIDIGYVKSGVLAVALSAADERALGDRRTWQTARGLRVEALSGAAARAREPGLGDAVLAALHLPDDAQVNPRALAPALSQAAAAAGARFLQGRYVRRVRVVAGVATGVELDGDTLDAGAVVVAAGSWSGLVEGAGVPASVVRPARGQLVAIETRPPLFRHVLSVHGRGYLVPRRDGTVLAGSTVEMVGFRKEVTVGGLAEILDLARTLVPALGRRARHRLLVEFPPLHRGPPAGVGRDVRPGIVPGDRSLPKRDLAVPGHGPGDRRSDCDGKRRCGPGSVRRRAVRVLTV